MIRALLVVIVLGGTAFAVPATDPAATHANVVKSAHHHKTRVAKKAAKKHVAKHAKARHHKGATKRK